MWEEAQWGTTHQSQLKALKRTFLCLNAPCCQHEISPIRLRASMESMCLCKREVRLAQECGHCLVREIPESVVILHASFIITGLVQLRERARGQLIHTHAALYMRTQLSTVGKPFFSDWAAGCVVQGRGGNSWQYGSCNNINADMSWLGRIIQDKDI